uniref:Uncharacterized protein n=1 Tax=Anopheles albimanus TaxID=7167 RepID=A0A182FZ75_ANOAL
MARSQRPVGLRPQPRRRNVLLKTSDKCQILQPRVKVM